MQRLLPVMMLLMLFNLTACQFLQKEPIVLPEGIQLEDKYYTQVTMQYEKGKFRTTNYRKGILVPVNTEVRLLEVTAKSITVMLIKQEKELVVVNGVKYTGDDIYQSFTKLFSKKQVNLNKFSSLERKNIGLGKAVKGMKKAAVLVAIGYPPITRTPTIEADEWVYWKNRFNTFIVHFSNGQVSRIQD